MTPTPTGTLRDAPPDDYWETLEGDYPPNQVQKLRTLFEQRSSAIRSSDVASPGVDALPLLSQLAQDGWLRDDPRHFCQHCSGRVLDQALAVCPDCGEAFSDHRGLKLERWFTRTPLPDRKVAWVAVLHGMNTRGVWQEQFNWLMATTWGRSVPVAIYKYGNIKTGVILPFRRRQLIARLRAKLLQLQCEAVSCDVHGLPDAVAHSFGTWLLGHLLSEEAKLGKHAQVRFGRIILTGSILRPDFDWSAIRDAGLVQEVLDHYGTRDSVVRFAEFTIRDSGPSGCQGFDGPIVLNVPAHDYEHGTFFSTEEIPERLDDKKRPMTRLRVTYEDTWKPFLTLPAEELRSELKADCEHARPWRPMPWILGATALPAAILVAAAALVASAVFGLGWVVGRLLPASLQLALQVSTGTLGVATAVGLLLLAVGWFLRNRWG